ncbi:hypothetical protein [Dolichospermum compactum]|uniref:Rpn family recombination-promoting nuclease/putative transposase n=1 Tax=Dolichospermum compactum NIES-806 TaxID=1973481 RepID=A0A1Z4UZ93_9CYAN|nr:hypothetical protein [Dolichospermum compactum]BAZ84566.1 hypothetical protein NIES806_07560 [Dolichospermum compactum NIES-806]
MCQRVLIYKFFTYSRQELEVMFGLTEWRQTRFYQEVKEEVQKETKLETTPRLLKMGLSVEQIAEALELKIEVVQQAMKQQSRE